VNVLIDLDLLLYKGLFACKDQYYPGLRATDNIINNVLERFDFPEYELVISGQGNFRKDISADYKANRKPENKPKYLYEAKCYYKKYWNAVETTGMEADDYIASSITDDCVICSEDKDFRQLGVPIFNPRTWTLTEITNPEYHFFVQALVGDRADNIPGLTNPEKLHHKNPPCFTEDTAAKVLEGKSVEEMKSTVIDLYKEIHKDEWYVRFDTACRLLYLRRKGKEEYFHWI